MSDHDLYPPQSPYDTGLKGLCPRCGQGHLFKGFIDIAPKCDACGMGRRKKRPMATDAATA